MGMSASEFTKYMIARSMKELLKFRSFENISVADIAQHCHISRNTIYYHFKDKYDIVTWIFSSEITPIMEKPYAVGLWTNHLLDLCRYLRQNRDFYTKVLHDHGQNSFYEYLISFCRQLIHNMFLEADGQEALTDNEINTICDFYAFGLAGMIAEWAGKGMETKPDETVETIRRLISGEIFDRMVAVYSGKACPVPKKNICAEQKKC